jgi:type IX secretion system PorP/SprF family membrane protein
MKALKVITMKRFIIILGVVLLGLSSKAQLLPQFSQFMFNDYAINPAVSGTSDYWQVRTNFRYQFVGIEGAPLTYMLSTYGPHKSMPMGYGGYLFSDNTGPISNLGMYGSYAYNVRITGDLRLSAGIFAGLVQQRVDLSSISTLNMDDQIFIDYAGKATKFYPDGSLGVYAYTSQYYVGFSWHHLFFNQLSLLKEYDANNNIGSTVKPHFYLHGGYKYNLNRNFDIIPNIMMKYVYAYDYMTDIAVRTIFQKQVWGGLGFRYSLNNPEALFIYVGYNYGDILNVGYSYDLGLGKFRDAHSGSHEIMISFKFDDLKKSKSKRKIR